MFVRALRIAQNFAASPAKIAWLQGRLAWKAFAVELRHQDSINRRFDNIYGTETADEIALSAVGIAGSDAERGNLIYRPLWENNFHSTITLFHETLGNRLSSYSFVDIGSGKGKLLLLASLYPFKRVRGIEYATGLHKISEKNISCFRNVNQRCHDIAAILGDALNYKLPPGPVVAMMFNAFDIKTTAKVLTTLIDQRAPGMGACFIIYENVRRTSEIGTAFDVPLPWETLERTRNRIVVGNAEAVREWRREFSDICVVDLCADADPLKVSAHRQIEAANAVSQQVRK